MPKLTIASRIQRPSAPITLPNGEGKKVTTYYFKPRDPSDPTSEHIAVVENPAHQQRLLKIDHCYYITDDAETTGEAAAAVARPTAKSGPADVVGTKTAIAPRETKEPVAETAVDVDTAAVELLKLPPKEFKVAVKSAPEPVLRLARRIEEEKKEEERPTFTSAIDAALAALPEKSAATGKAA
jgi:hypothetical protein